MNKIADRKKEEGKNDDEFISFIVKIDRIIGTSVFLMKLRFYREYTNVYLYKYYNNIYPAYKY